MITTRVEDFDLGKFAPDDNDGPALELLGKLPVDCTVAELRELMDFFRRSEEFHEQMATALAAEKQRRFGADVIPFPGGSS